MTKSTRKTFHFEPEFQKALEDFIEAYLVLAASYEVVRGILDGHGKLPRFKSGALVEGDKALVRLVRAPGWPGPAGHPNSAEKDDGSTSLPPD